MATLADSFLQVPRDFQGMDSGSSHIGPKPDGEQIAERPVCHTSGGHRILRIWRNQIREADELGTLTGSIMMSETAQDPCGRATYVKLLMTDLVYV